MVQSTVRDVRGSRALAERAKNPIPPRPADEQTPGTPGARGRYEALMLEVQRLLGLMRQYDASSPDAESIARATTIRMAKMQKELAVLRSDLESLDLLAQEVVSLVITKTS
jgi:hypothetical protein